MSMKMNMTRIVLAAAALMMALPVYAQRGRTSPHEAAGGWIQGEGGARARVTVYYGRPFAKGRTIWGELVPYGKPWRLGADEATLLVSDRSLQFGDVTVPAGAYSLYLLPQADGTAKLIINKQVGQWGTQYDEKQDLGRVDAKKETLNVPVEQLTIAVDRNPSGGGLLKISWDKTQYSVPFTVQR